MDILYRRFALVVAFIATMGALTANLIQETRTVRIGEFQSIEFSNPATPSPCVHDQLCANQPSFNRALAMVLAG